MFSFLSCKSSRKCSSQPSLVLHWRTLTRPLLLTTLCVPPPSSSSSNLSQNYSLHFATPTPIADHWLASGPKLARHNVGRQQFVLFCSQFEQSSCCRRRRRCCCLLYHCRTWCVQFKLLLLLLRIPNSTKTRSALLFGPGQLDPNAEEDCPKTCVQMQMFRLEPPRGVSSAGRTRDLPPPPPPSKKFQPLAASLAMRDISKQQLQYKRKLDKQVTESKNQVVTRWTRLEHKSVSGREILTFAIQTYHKSSRERKRGSSSMRGIKRSSFPRRST